MKFTIMTTDERLLSLDVDPDETVENLKALLEVETSIPINQQQLLYHGKEIDNLARLNAIGVGEGDLVMMIRASSRSMTHDLALNSDGSAVNPTAFQRHLRSDPNIIGQLLERNPDLAQAVLGDDVNVLQNILRQQHIQNLEFQRRQQQEIDLLNADPFDVDAQRKIEEAIQQKNIEENWEAALEHNPEAFASVIMLYVNMEVNGVPIKAFVDSGAQMTIISRTCAERCGLLRLMDKRYVGIAKGVGQSKIVGRIHVAPLKIGHKYYLCSFTVLDQSDVEFIFGLDMLRKHQCSIDLKDNVLRVGGGEIAVPFLQEKDLPPHVKERYMLRDSLITRDGASTSVMQSSGSILQSNQPTGSNPAIQVSDVQEVKIRRLIELGFDRQSAKRALDLCNGNEEAAASYLFGG